MVLDQDIPGKGYTWKETQRQAPHQMDEHMRDMKTYDLDDQMMEEGVVEDGGNSRHTLVYKTIGEKKK